VIANNQWRKAVQAYLATISFADAQIGRVLDALDRCGHASNTIIVLWGDHGWHLGEKEHWRKHALWNVSTRTPLIFVAPKGVARDQLCQRPVSLIDIYPTLIDLCGLPKREGLDGHSLKPLLENPKREWDRPVVMTYGFSTTTPSKRNAGAISSTTTEGRNCTITARIRTNGPIWLDRPRTRK
jgi:arylsulfatase A-like enzyme